MIQKTLSYRISVSAHQQHFIICLHTTSKTSHRKALRRFNLIDGGVAANNPVTFQSFLSFSSNPLWVNHSTDWASSLQYCAISPDFARDSWGDERSNVSEGIHSVSVVPRCLRSQQASYPLPGNRIIEEGWKVRCWRRQDLGDLQVVRGTGGHYATDRCRPDRNGWYGWHLHVCFLQILCLQRQLSQSSGNNTFWCIVLYCKNTALSLKTARKKWTGR